MQHWRVGTIALTLLLCAAAAHGRIGRRDTFASFHIGGLDSDDDSLSDDDMFFCRESPLLQNNVALSFDTQAELDSKARQVLPDGVEGKDASCTYVQWCDDAPILFNVTYTIPGEEEQTRTGYISAPEPPKTVMPSWESCGAMDGSTTRQDVQQRLQHVNVYPFLPTRCTTASHGDTTAALVEYDYHDYVTVSHVLLLDDGSPVVYKQKHFDRGSRIIQHGNQRDNYAKATYFAAKYTRRHLLPILARKEVFQCNTDMFALNSFATEVLVRITIKPSALEQETTYATYSNDGLRIMEQIQGPYPTWNCMYQGVGHEVSAQEQEGMKWFQNTLRLRLPFPKLNTCRIVMLERRPRKMAAVITAQGRTYLFEEKARKLLPTYGVSRSISNDDLRLQARKTHRRRRSPGERDQLRKYVLNKQEDAAEAVVAVEQGVPF